MNIRTCIPAVMATCLAGCASLAASNLTNARADQYQAAAGKPVSSMYLVDRNFYSWNAINDHQIVAFVTRKKAYLLDLPPCPGLVQSSAISYTSQMNRVSVNFDSITTERGGVPCKIRSIRPINLDMIHGAQTHAATHGQASSKPVDRHD
ncbi:DUF6491 family protein [Oleiagrimonas sp.]|jgi:hypothetical protein|uniref:DUF6491 family protein n=1 Tax=Oleiagrimonas sp. TaxID=2010330 RepID=UPI002616F799|nr:DUF6491 family protein [Oleiagrimonas sp.]MDA3913472.1 DUF6491 family protein [Oleiagrimonas sp.]